MGEWERTMIGLLHEWIVSHIIRRVIEETSRKFQNCFECGGARVRVRTAGTAVPVGGRSYLLID